MDLAKLFSTEQPIATTSGKAGSVLNTSPSSSSTKPHGSASMVSGTSETFASQLQQVSTSSPSVVSSTLSTNNQPVKANANTIASANQAVNPASSTVTESSKETVDSQGQTSSKITEKGTVTQPTDISTAAVTKPRHSTVMDDGEEILSRLREADNQLQAGNKLPRGSKSTSSYDPQVTLDADNAAPQYRSQWLAKRDGEIGQPLSEEVMTVSGKAAHGKHDVFKIDSATTGESSACFGELPSSPLGGGDAPFDASVQPIMSSPMQASVNVAAHAAVAQDAAAQTPPMQHQVLEPLPIEMQGAKVKAITGKANDDASVFDELAFDEPIVDDLVVDDLGGALFTSGKPEQEKDESLKSKESLPAFHASVSQQVASPLTAEQQALVTGLKPPSDVDMDKLAADIFELTTTAATIDSEDASPAIALNDHPDSILVEPHQTSALNQIDSQGEGIEGNVALASTSTGASATTQTSNQASSQVLANGAKTSDVSIDAQGRNQSSSTEQNLNQQSGQQRQPAEGQARLQPNEIFAQADSAAKAATAIDPMTASKSAPATASALAAAGSATTDRLVRSSTATRTSAQPIAPTEDGVVDAAHASQRTFQTGLQQALGAQGLRAEAQPPLNMQQSEAQQAVADKVQVMLSNNLKQIDIRLDPPELGRMQIKLNLNQDQASVQFTVSSSQAREIVEQTMPRLREMLNQQGLQLAQGNVQQDTSGRGQSQQGTAFVDNGSGNSSGSSNGRGGENGSQNWGPNSPTDEQIELFVDERQEGVDYYA